MTFADIKKKTTLCVGERMAMISQDYQTFAIIVSQALGGKKQQAKPPQTMDEAEAQLRAVTGG